MRHHEVQQLLIGFVRLTIGHGGSVQPDCLRVDIPMDEIARKQAGFLFEYIQGLLRVIDPYLYGVAGNTRYFELFNGRAVRLLNVLVATVPESIV
jgi:hypothetical protein